MGTLQAVMDIRVPFSTHPQPWTPRLQVTGWDSSLNRAYAQALQAELQANAPEFADVEFQAVRIGGGHGSHLGGEALWSVVQTVRSLYWVAPGAPVTMRTSIADISGASMPYFKRAGITRFDLEVLSLAETAYARVNPEGSLEFYPLLCNSFLHAPANDSLGLVLLVGSPAASDIEVRRSFLEAPHYHTAHVIVERYQGPDADDARTRAQLEDGCAVLEGAGLHEYAPMRFARPGCEDVALQTVARGGAVVGVGLGARTRFAGAETANTSDLDTYLACSHDFAKITVEAHAVKSR